MSGGGGGGAPATLPANISSEGFAHVTVIISEGPTQGPATANGFSPTDSFYFDSTPFSVNGQKNFEGSTIEWTNGEQTDQAFDSERYGVGITQDVNAYVYHDNQGGSPGYVTRSVDDGIDAVRVILQFDALSYTDDKGNTAGSEVKFKIEIAAGGGSTFEEVDLEGAEFIRGASYQSFEYPVRIDLEEFGAGPYQIRVSRITGDHANNTKRVSKFKVKQIVSLIDGKFNYPMLAKSRFYVSAKAFQNIPTLKHWWLGVNDVPVPVHYNTEERLSYGWNMTTKKWTATRGYDGEWNGIFKFGFTDDPAWLWRYVALNDRWSTGERVNIDHIDDAELYQISKVCNELVDDGAGGLEQRFSLSMYLQEPQDATTLLRDLASAMACRIYPHAGGIAITQDKAKPTVAIFTPANVVGGRFSYTSTPRQQRFTACDVSYIDLDNECKTAVEPVIASDFLPRYGFRKTSTVAIGCTSRAGAVRHGRRVIYSSLLRTESVSFSVGLNGLAVRPGDVFAIADPFKSTERRRSHGRLLAGSTASSLLLDAPTTIESGSVITVIMPDGEIEQTNITQTAGTYSALTVSPALSATPDTMAVYLIDQPALVTQRLFEVMDISEADDKTGGEGFFKITALLYDAQLYDLIDAPVRLEPSVKFPTQLLYVLPPSEMKTTHGVYADNLVLRQFIDVSWVKSPDEKVTDYRIQYSRNDGIVLSIDTSLHSTRIYPVEDGDYSISVYAIAGAARSMPLSGTITVPVLYDLTLVNITDFVLVGDIGTGGAHEFAGKNAEFDWDTDADTVFDFSAQFGIENFAIGVGGQKAWFRDFVVTVKNDNDTVRRVEYITESKYTYTYEKNQEDGAGTPARSFKLTVAARDHNGVLSQSATLSVSNPSPSAYSSAVLTQNGSAIFVKFDRPTDRDFLSTRIYASKTNGFTPSPATLVLDTPDTQAAFAADTGTWYVKLQSVDVFGAASSYSSQFSIAVDLASSLNFELSKPTATISADADGAVTGDYAAVGGTFIVSLDNVALSPSVDLEFVVESATGVTAAINPSTGVYTLSDLSALTAYVEFTATYKGISRTLGYTLTKVKDGSIGADGNRGSVTVKLLTQTAPNEPKSKKTAFTEAGFYLEPLLPDNPESTHYISGDIFKQYITPPIVDDPQIVLLANYNTNLADAIGHTITTSATAPVVVTTGQSLGTGCMTIDATSKFVRYDNVGLASDTSSFQITFRLKRSITTYIGIQLTGAAAHNQVGHLTFRTRNVPGGASLVGGWNGGAWNIQLPSSVTNLDDGQWHEVRIYRTDVGGGFHELGFYTDGVKRNSTNINATYGFNWTQVKLGTHTIDPAFIGSIDAFDMSMGGSYSTAATYTPKTEELADGGGGGGTQPASYWLVEQFNGSTWDDITADTIATNGANGSDAVQYYIDATQWVIYKDAPDAATSGAHTNITISGYQQTGSNAPTHLYLTVTANGDTEAATATQSPITTAIANNAGKTTYTAKLYTDAAKTTLKDTQVFPVVFKGAAGTNGAGALYVVLTNETHAVPTDSAGANVVYTGSGTDIYVYEGNTELVYDGVGTSAGKYNVTAAGTAITPGSKSLVGSHVRFADASAITADLASIVFTISGRRADNSAFTLTRTQTLSKNKKGIDGVGAAAKMLGLTQTALVFSYTGALVAQPASQTVTLTANKQNITGTVNWTLKFYDANGAQISTDLTGTGDTYNLTNATFESYSGAKYVTIQAKVTDTGVDYTANAQINKMVGGSNGIDGKRGSMTFYREVTGLAAWSDSEANAQVLLVTGSSDKTISDMCTLKNPATNYIVTHTWDGTNWIAIAQYIDGNLLVSGTVVSSALSAGAVTADKIATGAITADKIGAGEITATKIAAGAVTADALSISELSAITAETGSLTVNNLLEMIDGGTFKAVMASMPVTTGTYAGNGWWFKKPVSANPEFALGQFDSLDSGNWLGITFNRNGTEPVRVWGELIQSANIASNSTNAIDADFVSPWTPTTIDDTAEYVNTYANIISVTARQLPVLTERVIELSAQIICEDVTPGYYRIEILKDGAYHTHREFNGSNYKAGDYTRDNVNLRFATTVAANDDPVYSVTIKLINGNSGQTKNWKQAMPPTWTGIVLTVTALLNK